MSRLADKKVVITGASSGIGRGIALACAREGAEVIVNFNRSAELANAVVREIMQQGGQASAVQANISLPDDIARLISQAQEQMGRIDVWINNAGADILTGSGANLTDEEKLDNLIAVDLKGTILCCWALVPVMQQQGGGVIINMSWDLAIQGFQGRNPQMFAAVKAGVLGFSRAFAKTYAPGIRLNILAPGWIQTAFAEGVMEPEYRAQRVSEIPVGRFGSVEDVAAAAVFLASDESRYLTGEMIKVNGGLS